MLEKIESLENRICHLESSLEVSIHVNKVLRGEVDHLHNEVDRLEQYSRRTCLVIDGVVPVRGETNADLFQRVKDLTTNHLGRRDSVHPDEFNREFDKCHRIGPIKDNRQPLIIKFRSDNFREKLYRARKSAPNGVRFRVSLTKKRIHLIEDANKIVTNQEKIKFAYADINGNVKVLLKEKSRNGRWALHFNCIEELNELISEINDPISNSAPDTHQNESLIGNANNDLNDTA